MTTARRNPPMPAQQMRQHAGRTENPTPALTAEVEIALRAADERWATTTEAKTLAAELRRLRDQVAAQELQLQAMQRGCDCTECGDGDDAECWAPHYVLDLRAELAEAREQAEHDRASSARNRRRVVDVRAEVHLLRAERDAAVGLAGLPRHVVEAIAVLVTREA